MSALEPGSTLGGYRIVARLRAGAMGVLYLARRAGSNTGFSRPVAIKVIHDHLSQNKRFVRMFIDEAKLSARIDDPNVVRVEEFGEEAGRHYLVMEYVHGVSLAQAIGVLRTCGGIPMEIAVAIAIQIAGGLHGAHEATDERGVPLGIVHRDVSPHNVIVSYRGYVRLIDFGIAKARQVGGQTKTGSLRGKLAYMPPEQARSARTVDRRADLYGLGLVLWEMLTQRRVFDADTDIAILNQIRSPVILPPSSVSPSVPRALDDLVLKVLSQEPDGRPPTGLALQRALGEALPEALRVMPADLAALMSKVRSTATALAEGSDDPSGLYGEEVRRTLTIVGRSTQEGVEAAEDAIDTRPARAERADGVRDKTPSVIVHEGDDAVVSEDETTMRRKASPRPSNAGVLPADGVRPIVPVPPGSSPDALIPPPPLSSSRALDPAPRASSPEVAARASSPDTVLALAATQAGSTPRATKLTSKQKGVVAVAATATVVALASALAIVAGGPSEVKPSTPPPPARKAAALSASSAPTNPSPPLIAPIIIAPPPPDPVDDPPVASAAAAPARRPASPASKGDGGRPR